MPTRMHLETMEVEVPPTPAAQLRVTCGTDHAALASAMKAAFETLGRFVAANHLTPSGPPRAIYDNWGATTTSFTLAFPLATTAPVGEPSKAIAIGRLPGGRALRFTHRGSYTSIQHTYGEIDAWLRERGAIKTEADWARYRGMWEEYVNDPASVPESELITNIYLPLPSF